MITDDVVKVIVSESLERVTLLTAGMKYYTSLCHKFELEDILDTFVLWNIKKKEIFFIHIKEYFSESNNLLNKQISDANLSDCS